MLTALVAIAVGIGFALLAGRKGRSSRRRYSRVSTSSDPFLFSIDPSTTDHSHHHHHHQHHDSGHHGGFDGGHHGGFDGGGHH